MAKKNSITNKGIWWELLNSWWVLTSIIILAWVGFFYAGKTARQRKWTFCGCAYFITQFCGLIAAFSYEFPEIVNIICIRIWGISWVFGIIHSFWVRKEYLIRREIIVTNGYISKADENLKRKIHNEYMREQLNSRLNSASAPQSVPIQHEAQSVVQPATVPVVQNKKTIDINICNEEDLASLPGITLITAKKSISYRNEKGGFSSVDEFFELLALKPHFIVQLRELVICSAPATPDESKKGRVLDF